MATKVPYKTQIVFREKRYTLKGTVELVGGKPVKVVGVLSVHEEPAVPVGLRLVAVTDDLASIAWDDDRNATSWNVLRDTVVVATVLTPAHIESGLVASTAYDFQVVAVNPSGESDPSAVLEVTTAASAVAPNPPIGLTLEQVSITEVTISWTPDTAAAEWDVLRDLVYQGTVAETLFVDSGLSAETSYSYTVVARNATGDSAPSAALVVVTLANRAPVWNVEPQSGTVGAAFALDLNTLCEDFDLQPLTYTVLDALPPGLALNNNQISGSPTTAGNSTTTIRASDGIATVDAVLSFSIASVVDTTGPSAPVLGLAVINGSSVSIPLTTPSTDVSGILKYNMQRRTLPSGEFAFRGSLDNATSFPYVETGVANGSYEYRCRSEDASPARNLSEFSNTVSADVALTSPNPDTPINFIAVKTLAGDGANLSWSPGSGGAAPTGYDLEYSIQANGGSATGPWSDFVVSGAATTATHSALPTGRVWYRLRALSADGASAYTSVIFVDVGASVNPATFIIPAGTTSWNGATSRVPLTGGSSRAVRAGDIVEMEAGTYRGFTFSNIIGTLANPVVIRQPATGQVLFRSLNPNSGGFLVQFKNCHGFVTDGFTTDPAIPVQRDGKRHGFKCMYATNVNPASGQKEGLTAYVKFKGSSTSGAGTFDVSDKSTFRYWHIDMGWNLVANQSYSVTGTGGIGFDSNDNQYSLPNQPAGTWQESMIWEHFYVEDAAGEAVYFGGNPYSSFKPNGGADQHIPIRYVKCRYFMIYNSSGQALQFKSVYGGQGGSDEPTDNSVHDGIVIKSTQTIDASTNGTPALVLNSSKLDIYNMWFERCGAGAISVNVSEGTHINFPGPNNNFTSRIYNSVLVDCDTSGGGYNGIRVASYTGSTPSALPAAYKPTAHIFCTTILRHPGNAIEYTGAGNAAGSIRNNLSIGSGAINYGPIANDGSNITAPGQAAVFIDPVGSIIPADSSAIDLRLLVARLATTGTVAPAGTLPASWASGVGVPNFDYDGAPGDGSRSAATNPDCGAYEFTP